VNRLVLLDVSIYWSVINIISIYWKHCIHTTLIVEKFGSLHFIIMREPDLQYSKESTIVIIHFHKFKSYRCIKCRIVTFKL